MKIVFWIFLSLLLVVLSIGAYVFVVACVRRKELPWLVEEEIKKTKYAKYYKCIVESDAWLKAHNAQDIYVMSKDGLKLHAYWIPAENAKGTILLAHGYRSTILVDFGLAYVFYNALGFNLLVPHQRSHAMSEGKFITFGVKESEDMECWIQYHNESLGKHQMILSGMSMGASTVLFLADKILPENVKCIIADCGFTSPKAILKVVFHKVTHLPSEPFVWAADLFTRLFAGFKLNEKDTRRTLKNANIPVLIVHGTADDFVPCSMSREAYEICIGQKEILLVAGAGHGTSFLVDKQSYTQTVVDFLERHLEDF